LAAATFRFRRKSEKENQPLQGCTVQIFDAISKSPAAIDQKTNTAANDFEFSLLPEKSYMLVATRDGYQTDTLRFNTTGIKKTTKVEKKLTLRTVKPSKTNEPDSIVISINEPIRLNNIYYDYNKDNILADAEQDLQIILDLLKKYPDMKIELSSHTDSRGKDDYNEKLSQRRAESAKRWLTERGVTSDRIVPKGYGETVLLNACANGVECSDDEHRFNRRTEFKIIAGPTEITIQKIEKRKPTTTGDKPKN